MIMKMKIQPIAKTALPLTALLAAGFLAGCKEKQEANTPSTKVDPAITAVFVDAEPKDAIVVSEARKTAKAGETITVVGKIAGADNPFTEGFATVVVSDIALETCDLIPDDPCETPWDACCVDKDIIAASRLTIQVIGDDSRPVAQSLKGINGLKELDPIVVSGTVAEGSTKENLVVNVISLYRR